jgi:photosystem II stability/assembly factor-like uncharacterized protein
MAQNSQRAAYTWKNVQIVGGGFVDGVIFDPTMPGLSYARTDIGGAYRWDAAAHRWLPIMDWVGYNDANLMGVESIAVDPSDLNRVYLACGTYTNPRAPDAAILRSDDQGRTFQRTNLPFKLGGNEDGRGNGERLAVDPRDGRILYLGTPRNGLWRSTDRGVTWAPVASFPFHGDSVPATLRPVSTEPPSRNMNEGDGVVFVKFSPASDPPLSPSAMRTIYAGVSLMNTENLFVTHNGGTTWSAIPGEPTQYRPTRAAFSNDGFLYVTYGTSPGPSHMTCGAVWKLNTRTGEWTDITPVRPVAGISEFGYAAVSVDAHHPQTVIVSTFGRPHAEGGDNIFRSTDGGATWKSIFGGVHGGVFDYRLAPYVKSTPIHWLFDIEIDPTNSDHAVFTTGYGGWETHDLTDADRALPTHWSILAEGIEETVALALLSPPKGSHLISAIGDYGGFVHWNLNRPPQAGSSAPPRMANTTGVAAAALKPEVIVRVGVDAYGVNGGGISYSIDAGRTWQPTSATPQKDSRGGSVAVSANGGAWVWTPEGEAAYVTRDRGVTWTVVHGLPAGLRVIADSVDYRAFYAISHTQGTLYVSSDQGATFTAEQLVPHVDPAMFGANSRGDPRGGQDRIYAAPGHSGDLWLAAYDGLYHFHPLMHSAIGRRFSVSRLAGVTEIHAFGFGKAAAGRRYPTIYLAGIVGGRPGVFRSTDAARSWVRINDDSHQWGLILQIAGDPRIYGRVYIGTHGRGILYGDPISKPE